MIKVSVVMPVFNAERYLQIALDSLLRQTLNDIEIICVNDGSTDRTKEILEEYARRDVRIRIINQKNSYAGVARNKGMLIASGKYLSFLDADDYFKSDMLMEAYSCAEKTQAEIVVFGGEYFNKDLDSAFHNSGLLKEELLPYRADFIETENFESLFHFTTPSPWNKLYRRRFVEKHKLRFQPSKRVNDAYFVLVAFALAKRIGLVRKDLISYRTGNSNSLQGTNAESPLLFIEVFRSIKKTLIEKNLYNQNKQSFRNLCLSSCIYNLESLTNGLAFEELYNALKSYVFKEFDLVDSKRDDYYNKYAFSQYEYIMTHTATEYWQEKYFRKIRLGNKKEYLFPFKKIKKDSKIILYGAGNVGRKFNLQIKKSNYCTVNEWVDKNVERVNEVLINTPENVDFNNCDYIVIAIESLEIANKIKKWLLEDQMVDPNKIIWENPIIN
ncbi:MAG TPA: glycosyltransferase [Clostridiales bacterium]|nr:glycosyltransferase [Clostridiales bacterium]